MLSRIIQACIGHRHACINFAIRWPPDIQLAGAAFHIPSANEMRAAHFDPIRVETFHLWSFRERQLDRFSDTPGPQELGLIIGLPRKHFLRLRAAGGAQAAVLVRHLDDPIELQPPCRQLQTRVAR